MPKIAIARTNPDTAIPKIVEVSIISTFHRKSVVGVLFAPLPASFLGGGVVVTAFWSSQ